MPETIIEKCCSECTHDPSRPCPELVECLLDGPRCHTTEACRGLRSSRADYINRKVLEKVAVFVGTGTCGLGAGASETLEAIRVYLDQKDIDADVVEVGCVGLCALEPIVDIQMPGRARLSYCSVTAENAADMLEKAFAGDPQEEDLLGQYRAEGLAEWPGVSYIDEHPFFAPQKRWVLANCGIINPESIDEYIARGGYAALSKALRENTPQDVCSIVEESGLRGRGGGGFPTGRKWRFTLQTPAEARYMICNADEGDPGAFMDRAVIEGDPHRLLEGLALGAYAIGAHKAYVYIRAEYPLAIKRLRKAISQAIDYGLLGNNILGSGFELDVVIKQGAGAFVCGEETALMHSIEGKRGMPRPRPPYPAVKGLFDMPTAINNVETLANVAGIVDKGPQAFAAVGTETSKGTKVFALSGKVENTGLVEVAMGTTLRDIVFAIGGGVPGGRAFKAVQIGGPSGGCIPTQHLDIEIDYESLKSVGAMMGSGGLVVMDETTCMVDLAKYFMEFIQSESCGKCIPCREGTKRMLEILERITRGRRSEEGLDALERFRGVEGMEGLATVIRDTSLCGLGQTAPNPVLATLRWFRNEYEAHVFERHCPAGACKELVGAPCETGCPVGTEVWRYVAHIARGEYDQAYHVIREANPFPSTCSRVCHHPCEIMCRCGTTGGDPIAVRTLKRFAIEQVDHNGPKVQVKKATDKSKRVAIVGAGPAGLTAAHCLSAKGHRVTLYEKEHKAGGMLVCAIPEYRLPRDVLDQEIGSLLNENTELICGKALGRDFTVDSLFEEGYDAVYLAMGAHHSRKLGVPGEDVSGVLPGIDFLKAYNLEGRELATGKVGIVGGGNSAIDAARVARRFKDVESVTVYYRRTEAEMPAYREEIDAARREGIEIVELVAPVKVNESGGSLKGLRLQRNELGAPDDSGRRRPVPIPGDEYDVELDTLIVAISEDPCTKDVTGLTLTKWGSISTDNESHTTARKGVFAGGDVVRGPNTVVEAVRDGKEAAEMIDRFLTGKNLHRISRVKLPAVYVEPAVFEEGEEIPTRVDAPQLPLAQRVGFDEVELVVSEDEALREARRCLRCDLDFTRDMQAGN